MNRLNSLQLSVLVYWNSKNTKRLGKQIWWPSYSWDKPSQALHRQQAADERQQPGSPPQYLSTGPYGPSTDNGGSKVAHAWTPHSELKSVSEYYYENIRKTISCLLSYIFLLAGEKKKEKIFYLRRGQHNFWSITLICFKGLQFSAALVLTNAFNIF